MNSLICPRVSFETLDVSQVKEEYMNSSSELRYKEIAAYNRLINPYYMTPSFNKPFLSRNFVTKGFHKNSGSKAIMLLVKLQDINQTGGIIDDLSIDSILYTINELARDYDEVYMVSIVTKFVSEPHGKVFKVRQSDADRYSRLFHDELLPTLQKRVFSSISTQAEFLLSIQMLFDPNLTLVLEQLIHEFDPAIVVLSHHEDAFESRRSKFLHIVSNTVYDYCMKKMSRPVIIITNQDDMTKGNLELDPEKITNEFFKNLLESVPISNSSGMTSRNRSASRNRSPSPFTNGLSPFKSFDQMLRPTSTNDSLKLAPSMSADNVIHDTADIKRRLKRSLGGFRLKRTK